MRILVVHPLMSILGGGERLCCETIRLLTAEGHELTLLSGQFQVRELEAFFGFEGIFEDVNLSMYSVDQTERFGGYKNLIHHARAIRKFASKHNGFDLVFSTQDAGYIPDMAKPVLQWGYFPNFLPRGLYGWPMRVYYRRKICRINLILAISEYSKKHFDSSWGVPTRLVYPACNMINPSRSKDRIVVTAARSVPEKQLELFWKVATQRSDYQFILLLTQDPRFVDYSKELVRSAPSNGLAIVNPDKNLYQETLAKSSIYLHLMNREHFGITVVEAMSAGCVPIVHDSGGPREIVGDAGLIWHNVDEIPRLLDYKPSFESLSSRARIRAQMFSRERFDASLCEVIEEIAERVP